MLERGQNGVWFEIVTTVRNLSLSSSATEMYVDISIALDEYPDSYRELDLESWYQHLYNKLPCIGSIWNNIVIPHHLNWSCTCIVYLRLLEEYLY